MATFPFESRKIMGFRRLLRFQRYPGCTRSSSTGESSSQPPDYFNKERLAGSGEAFRKKQLEAAPSWLRAFMRKNSSTLELYRFNPMYFTMEKFRAWKERSSREAEIAVQSYIEERHTILGNDLATATFIIFRCGKAKFLEQDRWFELDMKTKKCPGLPTKFVRNWFLEAVDASKTDIRYEGLENFFGLPYISWMSFADCPNVDDWFVDRLTCQVGASLEYLDLSGCPVTERMLSAIYRCPKLKELVLGGNIVNTVSFKLGCLLLEDAMPGLTVSGFQYMQFTSSEQN